jgi:hypothetical protein
MKHNKPDSPIILRNASALLVVLDLEMAIPKSNNMEKRAIPMKVLRNKWIGPMVIKMFNDFRRRKNEAATRTVHTVKSNLYLFQAIPKPNPMIP